MTINSNEKNITFVGGGEDHEHCRLTCLVHTYWLENCAGTGSIQNPDCTFFVTSIVVSFFPVLQALLVYLWAFLFSWLMNLKHFKLTERRRNPKVSSPCSTWSARRRLHTHELQSSTTTRSKIKSLETA